MRLAIHSSKVCIDSARVYPPGFAVYIALGCTVSFLVNHQRRIAVKVSIKDLAVNMDLGNNGVTFDVYDNNGKFLGDLRLGKALLNGAKGKHKRVMA